MSPRQRTPWQAFERRDSRRRAVEGGVRVARPADVTGDEARRLVGFVDDRTTQGIGSRGRTYARAGQVVEVRVTARTASAAIQGSDDAPYAVALRNAADGDVEAECSCPYGCDGIEWCKHAAALAYVVAHLVDTDPGLAAVWTGQRPPATAGAGDGGSAAGGSSTGDPDGGPDGAAGVPAATARAIADRLRAALDVRPVPADAAAAWAAAQDVLPLP